MFKVFGFYKFIKIKSLKRNKDLLQKFLSSNNIRGTIIIAKEGLNGTISGSFKDIDKIIKKLELLFSFKKFDLVFIDADKMNYKEYYEKSLRMLKQGGLIIIDNVLWHGEVVDEKNNDKFTVYIREFNKFVSEDKRVEQIIIPLGDGMTICRVL